MNCKMDQMQSGLTIAGVSQDEMHPTVVNYHKFGKKYWDDGPKTFSKKGYYFAYYFQKKFVYIHKIIDIVQPADRPPCMEWSSDRPILCLSEQLKAFTWDEWIHGAGLNAPYTPNYHMLPTTAWSYVELHQHKKFNTFQFIQFKNIVEPPTPSIEVVHSPVKDLDHEIDEDEEERRLLEQLKANRAKKAQREAVGRIEELRGARGVIIHAQITDITTRIYDLTKLRDELHEEAGEVARGKRDDQLTAEIVAQAEQIQIAQIGRPTKKSI